ncbi:MAG: class I SAM-dependent methyltransferase [Bdellovibrionales bacterium]|nr:class I SAM-dependent methyltransferase [Bdellovibrionales bacterium]
MKQILRAYFEAVKEWDFTHRLVGQKPVTELMREATDSLNSLQAKESLPSTIVDIGAGSGLMGMAWLCLSENHRAVFVEPKAKARAFLLNLCSSVIPELSDRTLVLGGKVEDVSRETVASFANGAFFGVARAFSGASSLEEALLRSQLKGDPHYVFSSEVAESSKPKYVLNKINLLNRG